MKDAIPLFDTLVNHGNPVLHVIWIVMEELQTLFLVERIEDALQLYECILTVFESHVNIDLLLGQMEEQAASLDESANHLRLGLGVIGDQL